MKSYIATFFILGIVVIGLGFYVYSNTQLREEENEVELDENIINVDNSATMSPTEQYFAFKNELYAQTDYDVVYSSILPKYYNSEALASIQEHQTEFANTSVEDKKLILNALTRFPAPANITVVNEDIEGNIATLELSSSVLNFSSGTATLVLEKDGWKYKSEIWR